MARQIVSSQFATPEEAKRVLQGLILRYEDAASLGIVVQPRKSASFYTPQGDFLARFMADIWDDDEELERTEAFSGVKGDLRNRPEIIGKGARFQLTRVDGTPTDFTGVPRELLQAGGKASTFGYYRYKNSAPGVADCRLTAASLENLPRYLRQVEIERQITKIYARHLPKQYAVQKRYVDAIKEDWKNEGSVFSSGYGLKDQPCAVHVDKFDIPSGTGVITTTGCFEGDEFCMPEFGIAFDLQPSDLLFCDVHRWHGNFPRRSGSRTSQTFFVRKGMHECP